MDSWIPDNAVLNSRAPLYRSGCAYRIPPFLLSLSFSQGRLLTSCSRFTAAPLLLQIDSDSPPDQFPGGKADIPEHQQAVDAQGVVDVGGPPVCQRLCTRRSQARQV